MAVDHIPFNRDGLCGAACAQMVLHARGLIGSTPQDQETLWSSIKAHTHGKSPSKKCSGLVPEPFAKMIREACDSSRKLCWESYPDALQETLEAYGTFVGTDVKVTLTETTDEDAANDVIKKCLDRGGLPIVLIKRGTHWVVVSEWHENDSTTLKMLDPADDDAVDKTLGLWNAFDMVAVDCGKYNNKYVVLEVD